MEIHQIVVGGVTSGLVPGIFLATFIAFVANAQSLTRSIDTWLICSVGLVAIAYTRYLSAKSRGERFFTEDELRVPTAVKATVGTKLIGSDDPIDSWEQDAIGRIGIVESLAFKLMATRSPVVLLLGDFGSGKTSILNLLRDHLNSKAVVVSFSTWLPGSQETLISYLLSDIANECQKQYFVPGLRRSAQRLAKALGQNVPILRSYLEALPSPTQRDDIENLNVALSRVPSRVIVLLDELDRMEKGELLVLLKVIRGITKLPKVGFVCAGERSTLVKMVNETFDDEGNEYFEKFFPASIPIPKIPPSVIQKVGAQQLVDIFIRRNWLQAEIEVDSFRRQLDLIWPAQIAPFCRTFRAIRSLSNDVEAAALRVGPELHPLDLTLIELLRRFKPEVYELIGKSAVALTGGEGMFRGGPFLLERERTKIEAEFVANFKKCVPEDEQRKDLSSILGELFPRFQKFDQDSSFPKIVASDTYEKGGPRISQARIFSAYFDYSLPENVFSYAELNALLNRMNAEAPSDRVEKVFADALNSLDKGSLKRDDFLSQLAVAVEKTVNLESALGIVHAAVRSANKYTYDQLATFGEAGHVLRMIIRAALRLGQAERVKFLGSLIMETTDDTMALNITTRLPGVHSDFDLGISEAQLHPIFIERMRKRYGPEIDVDSVDLSTSDPWAFNYWGHRHKDQKVHFDPEDRSIQTQFWLRHIGRSRKRLAEDFRAYFLPGSVSYSSDVEPFVENKIPVQELKRLYVDIPEDIGLTTVDRQTLKTMERLFKGDFRNGTEFSPYQEEGPGGTHR